MKHFDITIPVTEVTFDELTQGDRDLVELSLIHI